VAEKLQQLDVSKRELGALKAAPSR
jgi:hypothetical protein